MFSKNRESWETTDDQAICSKCWMQLRKMILKKPSRYRDGSESRRSKRSCSGVFWKNFSKVRRLVMQMRQSSTCEILEAAACGRRYCNEKLGVISKLSSANCWWEIPWFKLTWMRWFADLEVDDNEKFSSDVVFRSPCWSKCYQTGNGDNANDVYEIQDVVPDSWKLSVNCATKL